MILKKQPCAHCGKKTRLEFEGKPTCPECRFKIISEREPVRKCPVCGKDMGKAEIEGILVDKCECGGVWFDPGELEEFTERVQSIAHGF